ncbi:hypothetical protein D6789_04555 [Candidatus Woesearchaeota archaeon]|nr:MAG: hypothetical protein D6789_04555 [Candidatus Woesearchaeota archaeon]
MSADVVLTADIGGTNATFGVYRLTKDRPEQLRLVRKPTQHTQLLTTLKEELAAAERAYGPVTEACLSVAGPITLRDGKRHVAMTNASWVVDEGALLAQTRLKRILILNDFQAIGYATNILQEGEYRIIQGARGGSQRGQRACIGAGTDFGKCILYEQNGVYHALDTEGGTADLPLYDEEDLALAQFIIKEEGRTAQLCEGDLLSGRGLERIYRFLSTHFPDEPQALDAQGITATRTTNACSAATLALFVKHYARAARNYVFNAGAWNGLYIAGGIARRIPELFSEAFLEEFLRVGRFQHVLAQVPLFLITNYDISTVGAAYALAVTEVVQ